MWVGAVQVFGPVAVVAIRVVLGHAHGLEAGTRYPQSVYAQACEQVRHAGHAVEAAATVLRKEMRDEG